MTDVPGAWPLHLPGGGVAWATEDPSSVDPHLNVMLVNHPTLRNGQLMEPARFILYSNYAAFIKRWELVIAEAHDTRLLQPIGLISGQGINFSVPIEWSGRVPKGTSLEPGKELVYVLRVYDAKGRMDETQPTSFRLSGEESQADQLEPARFGDVGHTNQRQWVDVTVCRFFGMRDFCRACERLGDRTRPQKFQTSFEIEIVGCGDDECSAVSEHTIKFAK